MNLNSLRPSIRVRSICRFIEEAAEIAYLIECCDYHLFTLILFFIFKHNFQSNEKHGEMLTTFPLITSAGKTNMYLPVNAPCRSNWAIKCNHAGDWNLFMCMPQRHVMMSVCGKWGKGRVWCIDTCFRVNVQTPLHGSAGSAIIKANLVSSNAAGQWGFLGLTPPD